MHRATEKDILYYTPDVTAALHEVWEIASESCGENPAPMIGEHVDSRLREKDGEAPRVSGA